MTHELRPMAYELKQKDSKGRVQKTIWKFLMAFAMKGGGVSGAIKVSSIFFA